MQIAVIPFLLASLAAAGEPVQLTIKDPSGAPAALALCQVQGSAIEVRATNEGICRIDDVPDSGKVRVSKPGFRTATVDAKTQELTLELDRMHSSADVVVTTPLPGIGLSPNEVPAPTQFVDQGDAERSGALDFSDLLNRRVNGVYFNEMQGNPFQPDVNYRGYTASPLLGTPQGLSVYMDGVRLNEAFGDIVSWDLIPKSAISEVTLIPGSNPLFGLNTLGGALAVATKDGYTAPHTSVQAYFGKYGRKAGEFEHGRALNNGFHWFATGNLFGEDGWRESSPTTVRQLFGKFGRQARKTSWNLSAAHANNALIGNGLQEKTFLERDFRSVYTKPDATYHNAQYLNFNIRHNFSSRFTVNGNGHYRRIQTRTLNGDINEDSLDQALYQPNAAERLALANAGYTGFPISGETAANTPFPSWRCIAQVLLVDEPAEKCNGLLNRSNTSQHIGGFAGQASWFSTRNQLTIGASNDFSHADFGQTTQLGYLNPDRSVTGLPAFADGVTGGEEDGVPFDTRVDLRGRTRTTGLYATNLFRPAAGWNLSLGGRFQNTNIDNFDRIRPLASDPASLTGNHSFNRFNPSAGVTYAPAELVSLYFSYNEGSRAPTAIELGCANPDRPCKLPNAMAGDPPLKQVVTRTLEGGVRGGAFSSRLLWNAGWFRGANSDDILFVASPQTGYGYFKNFGKTKRQGLQLDAKLRYNRLHTGIGYTFLDSTFGSRELVNGEASSAADDSILVIQPGDRIPLTPKHMLKFYADVAVTSRLTVDVAVNAVSSSIARGNENNQHAPDGQYFLGPGYSPGYAVTSLGVRYRIVKWVEWFGQVNNLFDKRYYSAAQLGPMGFTSTGSFIARPFGQIDGEYPIRNSTFYAPGMPRMMWMGLKVTF